MIVIFRLLDIQTKKKIKTKKNPNVDTSFLPDKEREEREEHERYLLKLEWLKMQEKIKGTSTIHNVYNV